MVIRKLGELNVGQEIREELSARTSGKKGNADDGRRADHRFGVHLDDTLGHGWTTFIFGSHSIATSLFAAIGFADDYIKIVKKRSLGLTGKQKLAGQLLTAVGVWASALFLHELSVEYQHSVL